MTLQAKHRLIEKTADKFGTPDTIWTPFPLIEEIVDSLPVQWDNPSLRFLDPACGRGAFLWVIKQKLLPYHDPKHIVENMLFGIDIAPKNALVAAGVVDPSGRYKNNIECADTLTKEFEMKFDVIVGNPPYKDGDSKNAIYQRFYAICVNDLLKQEGYLALVTPTPMLKGLAGGRVDKVIMPSMRNPVLINVSDIKAKHFKGVGSSFCYFVVQNKDYSGSTLVETDTGQLTVPFTGVVPVSSNLSLAFSIWNKCFSGDNEYGRTTSDVGKNSPRLVGGTEVVRTINANGSLDTYTVRLANPSHPLLNTPKVMLTIMGRKAFVDYNHNALSAADHLMASLPTQSDDESESLMSLLTSKLERMHAQLYSESKDFYYSFIGHLRRVPLDRIWTDKQLYSHFKLTKDEIKLIEDTVK